MVNKKFSLHEAYVFGFKAVVNNFIFFFLTMVLGAFSCLLFLSALGLLDYAMFYDHFQSMITMFSHSMNEATGALHSGAHTVSHHVRAVVPATVAKHVAPASADATSIDISNQSFMDLLTSLLPIAIAFKLFLQMISIGWTKIALDLQANKQVSYDYLYKYYYFVLRVLFVDLFLYFATIVGLMIFIFPGIFVYQRLRFARYFIIDKNQSITKALESSWAVTEGSVLHLFGFTIYSTWLSSLGNMMFLTMFFIFPLGYQVEAHVYRQMVK